LFIFPMTSLNTASFDTSRAIVFPSVRPTDRDPAARAIGEVLIKSGLRAPITARIRHEIWVNILGNVAFSPLSALTRATLAGMVREPEVCGIVRNIMAEAEAVAAKLGMELPITIDQRIAGAEKVGEHTTSMLQDLEAGRPMELEAVVELGGRLGVAMPHTRTVYAAARLLDQNARGTK
jgi:2-dehydropantoate 2-reductase